LTPHHLGTYCILYLSLNLVLALHTDGRGNFLKQCIVYLRPVFGEIRHIEVYVCAWEEVWRVRDYCFTFDAEGDTAFIC